MPMDLADHSFCTVFFEQWFVCVVQLIFIYIYIYICFYINALLLPQVASPVILGVSFG